MPKDYRIPFQDLTNLVPKALRNSTVSGLLDNLFNRFLTRDESAPLYGFVGRPPADVDARAVEVPQPGADRRLNALVPVLWFRAGAEVHSFTPQDLIRRAEALGVPADQSAWLYSQANNYAPPVDLDRFTNFFNYYWVADALPTAPTLPWNPTLAPEYTVIAAPAPGDLDKLNVRVVAEGPLVLTGTGFEPLTWTMTFTSPTTFDLTAVGPLDGYGPATQSFTLSSSDEPISFAVSNGGPAVELLSFNVTRGPIFDGDGVQVGTESFAAGDQFQITAPFLSGTYTVSFSGGPGVKGRLTRVRSLSQYQAVDGVTLRENDRVLVAGAASADAGIWVVRPGAWARAADFDAGTWAAGARVFVREGATRAGTRWLSSGADPLWTWALDPSAVGSNTNDWQEGNFWVHRDDLIARADVDPARAVQAVRPILQFAADLQLNSHVSGGRPAPAGTPYVQAKTEFNQAPLYDLFRYDGTPAGLASSIFFYVEDPEAAIDVALQRRVKASTTESADFLFDHGLTDADGSLLFYRRAGELRTIWAPGYQAGEAAATAFAGDGDGSLAVTAVAPLAEQQIWTLTATSATTFSIAGSKTAVLPAPLDVVTVGVPYANNQLELTVTAGPTPFSAGDTFTVLVGGLEVARYVTRAADGSTVDLYGGPAADVDGVGAWATPRQFFHNVAAANRAEVPEGTLYSHFRGILANQLPGAPEVDTAFGGSIKLWSEQQNLLASLLMQRDLTPVSLVDEAQRQYEAALNGLTDLYLQRLVPFMAQAGAPAVGELLDYLLAVRAEDYDSRAVLGDSTSPLPSFPPTLPQLGVSPLVQPGRVFDGVLGVELLRHHDGHLSPLYVDSLAFRDRLLNPTLTVPRSDGTQTPAVGSFTTAPPAQPYLGELWLYPVGTVSEMRVFNVIGDTSVGPASPVAGDYWYDRPHDALYVYTGAAWAPEPDPLAPWVTIDPAETLNAVLAEAERRLHDGLSPDHRTYFTEAEVAAAPLSPLGPFLRDEFATWAAANGLDPLAPDYVPADPFTWNYSGLSTGSAAPVAAPAVPARWHRFLVTHQATVAGVLPTPRPNLEPWRLVGEAVKPAGWDAAWASPVTPDAVDDPAQGYSQGPVARVVIYSPTPVSTPLTGLPTVDGVALAAGDRVLLTSEAVPAQNGLWVASSGAWSRAPDPLPLRAVLAVAQGQLWAGTAWAISAVGVVGTDPIVVDQVRLWRAPMWDAIQALRPGLRLSVDPTRDALLPPYVNPAVPAAAHALTSTVPPSPASPYQYGESSPAEAVWVRSVEYRYSLARALFRADPLAWLGHLWGFEWVEVDGILYDGFDVSVPGHKRFRLHGEPVAPVARVAPLAVAAVSGPGPVDLTVVHDAYAADRSQSWSVWAGDVRLGSLREGQPGTVSAGGYSLTATIEDEGRPFRVGDAFRVTATAVGGDLTVAFTPAPTASFLGFGQVFSQALRAASVDEDRGYAAAAYRGWDVSLGHRAGAFVSTEDLRVFTESAAVPAGAFELRFKKNGHARDLWLQGLRVTAVVIGSSTTGPTGAPVATGDASDWTFRIEGYNSRYLGFERYALDTAGPYVTFQALSGAHTAIEWRQYTDVAGVDTSPLPVTVTGLQNLVNILFGYSRYLVDQGWEFNVDLDANIDAETGRARTWQLEIEKVIDRVYSGLDLGQGEVVNPFLDKVWVAQPTGLLARFRDTALADVRADPAVYDTLGARLAVGDLRLERGRERSALAATAPMFGAHVQIDEYEHLFVFANAIDAATGDGTLYDPFSGARVATLLFNGRRQASQTLRPEYGGHYLVGAEARRNLQASTDALRGAYDPDHAFEDGKMTEHALALLGFSEKSYLTDLDMTARTQFNFWRGLIQMKGTNSSVDAYLNNDRFKDAKLDEYWAYKVAEYGDARPRSFPELRMSVADTQQQFTRLLFDPTTVPADYQAFTVVRSDDESAWFSIEDLGGETSFRAEPVGRVDDEVPAGVLRLPFAADRLVIGGTAVVTQLNASALLVTTPGHLTVTGWGGAAPRFNPVKLFNYVASELVEEIALWHPAAGQHAPLGMESVNIVSAADPARYAVSTQTAGNPDWAPLHAWGAREVGRTWWDTAELAYVPYHDVTRFPSVDDRLARWGALADHGAVNVYEWVESSVPPAQYEALAAEQAGDADAAGYDRADGTPARATTYVRERDWRGRAVAWSRAGVASAAAHPALGGTSAGAVLRVSLTTGLADLDTGSFEERGIGLGWQLGAWQQDDSAVRPLSAWVVDGPFTKRVLLAGVDAGDVPVSASGLTGVLRVSVPAHAAPTGDLEVTEEPAVSTRLSDADGNLLALWDVTTYLRVTATATGLTQVVEVRSDRSTVDPGAGYGNATFSALANQVLSVALPAFGLSLDLTVGASGTFPTNALVDGLVAALAPGLRLRDAVAVSPLAPLVDPDSLVTDPHTLSNDPLDPLSAANGGVGWRAWEVPTQAQLNGDAAQPDASWRPYVGGWFNLGAAPLEVVQAVADGQVLTLNDGTAVPSYSATWGDWAAVRGEAVEVVAEATGQVTLALSAAPDRASLSVYRNGSALLGASYSVSGAEVTTAASAGDLVRAQVSAYSPTAAELAFDPDVEDDLRVQRQYKVDYQYTAVTTRDQDGEPSTTRYYFWVAGRSVPARGKRLSVKAAAQLLRDGPSSFLTFQHLIGDGTASDPLRYDAVAIGGLSYLVTQDDTFKLRFTRNFTLRDDPEQLNLKDVHTEWALLREGQRTRVPERLWALLTNAACGADPAGNPLPSPQRVAYDDRNGTTTALGFGDDQVIAPTDAVRQTLTYTILNTRLVNTAGATPIPDYMTFLDFSASGDWFATPEAARATMTQIWNEGSVAQVNELFFAALGDVFAYNYQVTDLFKTSRLAAYSIKTVLPSPAAPSYE